MKSDRKRLKCEKLELLNQTRDLYKVIESKENEIRDVLKAYELRTKETSFAVKKAWLFFLFKDIFDLFSILSKLILLDNWWQSRDWKREESTRVANNRLGWRKESAKSDAREQECHDLQTSKANLRGRKFDFIEY